MPILHKNITAETDIHNPKWFSNANNGDYAWKNEQGNLESIDELLLPAALNFVDGSVAPPTSNVGDIYVLSSGGSVDAGWGSVSLQDWVRYDGAAWNSITPQKSSLCYNENSDTLLSFDGLAWAAIGGGIDNVTSAQKAALSPNTGDFVYDTDLNALQRYDGSNWVDIAKGYGIIEVITDSDSGVPTYFTDLQSALETCKTAGSTNIINVYSNITITSSININRSGTGVGNGYEFKNLTIDFNGFTLTNNESDSSYCFDISFGNIASENRQITFKNGIINRTSGTGTHYALHCDEIENDGHLIMSNMKWYCENSISARLEIDELDSSYKDFGGSVFESDSGYPLWLQHYSCKNFTTISNSSAASFYIIGGSKASNFEVFNTSTGDGIDIGDASFIYDFKINVSSGIGIDCFDDFDGECSRFKIITTTGDGIETIGTNSVYNPIFSHFVINCQNGVCIDSNHTNTDFSHFTLINNGTNDTLNTLNNRNTRFKHGVVKNLGSGNALDVTNTREMNFEFVNFTSFSDSAVDVSLDNAIYNVVFKNCNLFSKLDTTSGHSAEISNSTGSITFMNCTFETFNSGANGLYAASARTISVGNSGFKGMTTPINTNITISLTTAPDGNGNYTS
jgi:hypothetical protein